MNKKLEEKLTYEFLSAKDKYKKGNFSEAFTGFEKVHILGQQSVYWHTASHFYMLKIGLAKHDFYEVIGQIVRIPLGIIGSSIGIVPTGNTGGANIGLFKKIPIPEDLKDYLE